MDGEIHKGVIGDNLRVLGGGRSKQIILQAGALIIITDGGATTHHNHNKHHNRKDGVSSLNLIVDGAVTSSNKQITPVDGVPIIMAGDRIMMDWEINSNHRIMDGDKLIIMDGAKPITAGGSLIMDGGMLSSSSHNSNNHHNNSSSNSNLI